jgi:hypothetical protein
MQDFFDIFMSGSGPDDIPDHIMYIRLGLYLLVFNMHVNEIA